jgi:hypothetical protein
MTKTRHRDGTARGSAGKRLWGEPGRGVVALALSFPRA